MAFKKPKYIGIFFEKSLDSELTAFYLTFEILLKFTTSLVFECLNFKVAGKSSRRKTLIFA